MSCGTLGNTGVDASIALIALLGAVCLLGAGAIILAARRRRIGMAAVGSLALLAVVSIALGTADTSPAVAACAPSAPANSLTITQTSVISDLAPQGAPVDIRGTVTNNSLEATFIDAVKVSISGVTVAVGASPGSCDASDFVLLDPIMTVGQTLPSGGTTVFSGASLALADSPWNQDACQRAIIHLSYVTG
jgi:LPXTG-motif cell wall-anchored protein